MQLSIYWWYLLVAIISGVLGTVCMKLSLGHQKIKPLLALIIFYIISFAALTLSLGGIELSIVYAIWSGVGTLLIAFVGFFVFKESMSLKKMISLLLIVIGVLGVHLANALQ